jgi:hypothetical protein
MEGPVAFGAEISENRQRAAIAAGFRGKSGKVVAELVWHDDPAGAVVRLNDLYLRHDPVAVVIDGRSPAATLLPRLAEAGIVVTQPSAVDLACATGEFFDLVNHGGLGHLGQPALTDAVRGALRRILAGGKAWDRRAGGDQSPLLAGTLACWGFLRWEEMSSPGAWVLDDIGPRGGGRADWEQWPGGIPPWVQRG